MFDENDVSSSDCDTCALAKNEPQNNHADSTVTEVSQLLELVHTNLEGRITPTSCNDNRFVAMSTDDLARLKSVYFPEKNSDALDATTETR